MKAKVVLFFVCVALLMLVSALGTEIAPVQLSADANKILEYIDDERAQAGQPSLIHDIVYSHMVEKNLLKILAANNISVSDSAAAIDLGFHVLDWHRVAFIAIDASLDEIADRLLSSQAFKQALTDSEYTHVVVGSSLDISDETAVIVCFIQRFVHLGPIRAKHYFRGQTYLTISGCAPNTTLLRVTFYKGTQLPDEREGDEVSSEEVVPDKDGHFTVVLPISKFGAGEYRIVVYIQPEGSETLIIASLTRFTVPSPVTW
jgi:hypothetical protein